MFPNSEELGLADRAAAGDGSAREELARRADAEEGALRRRAERDRRAALEYRERIRQRLRVLEPVHGQLAAMSLEAEKRKEIEKRVAQQQTEALRELAWIETLLERRGRQRLI